MESRPINSDRSNAPSYTDLNRASAAHAPLSAAAAESLTADGDAAFICNICLEVTLKDPVVTQCGHLYCWSCLFRWLNTNHTSCPVCKAGVNHDNIIPVFIRGNDQDPRGSHQHSDSNINNMNVDGGTNNDQNNINVPNRPIGRRPEIQPNIGGMNTGGGGQPFSVGFGFFPSLFGLQFQVYTPEIERNPNAPPTAEETEHQRLAYLMTVMGCVVIFSLIIM